ncbi:MAG: glycerophosphodiester phosphodiesterase [Actinomycetota bacterium]
MTRPIVVAHAGASGHAPANTFGAYRRAHSTYDGCFMEFDAQFSADDQLMAIHDETLDRTTKGTGYVADHTAEQLQEIDASKGFPDWGFEPVARVRDILETGRDEGWRLICEVKNIPGQRRFDHTGESYGEALCALISSTAFPLERLVVICFWAPTLDEIKKRNDKIALGYLTSHVLPGGMKGLSAEENANICREKGYHVSAPNHAAPDLTAEHVSRCRADGIQVHVWTTNEPDHISAAVRKDLDGITSDYPERVLTELGR